MYQDYNSIAIINVDYLYICLPLTFTATMKHSSRYC